MLLVQVPPSPTPNRLYAAILDGLGVPGAMAMHGGRAAPLLEGLALRLLRQVGCRMLMLNELHNLLAAPTQRQRELLNLLRYRGNELRIPLACLGTRGAYLAIRGHSHRGERRWPLHPQPGEWEGLESYVRRLAQAYGAGYDIFLRCALGRAGPGARDLHEVSDKLLTRLSVGTDVLVERLRAMVGWSVMVRLLHRARDWLGTPEGREAIKELRVTIVRRQRRMPTSREL